MTNRSTPIINHFVALVKLKSMDNSLSLVEGIANGIINDLDLNIVKKIHHNFHPQGTTLALLLSQSHLVIHTWPEFSTIHIDLVTCSSRKKEEFENSVKASMPSDTILELTVKSVNFDKQDT